MYFLYSRRNPVIFSFSKNGYSLSPRNGDQIAHFSFTDGFCPVNAALIFLNIFDQNPSSSSSTYQYSATSCSAIHERNSFLLRYLIRFFFKVYLSAERRSFSPSSSVSHFIAG